MGELRRVIALGTFDGVHLGHRSLFKGTAELAEEHGLEPMIYTFKNHPLTFFSAEPPLIMTAEERIEALREASGFPVVADGFDGAMANTSPEEFVRMLMDRFNMFGAVVGYNYTFGKGGRGDTALLEQLGEKLRFLLRVIPPVNYGGEPVSSTRIRALIEKGEIGDANAMLTKPYRLTGAVVGNRGIGHALGFPTANIAGVGAKAMPAGGVYATRAAVDGQSYMSVTNIGSNPTVGGKGVSIETHLIGFQGDLYGKELGISFIKRLRDERRFPSVEALSAQIAADVADAKRVLGGEQK